MVHISKNLGDTTFSVSENRQVPLSEKHLSIVINGFKSEAEMDLYFQTISSMILYRNKINAQKKRAQH